MKSRKDQIVDVIKYYIDTGCCYQILVDDIVDDQYGDVMERYKLDISREEFDETLCDLKKKSEVADDEGYYYVTEYMPRTSFKIINSQIIKGFLDSGAEGPVPQCGFCGEMIGIRKCGHIDLSVERLWNERFEYGPDTNPELETASLLNPDSCDSHQLDERFIKKLQDTIVGHRKR